METKHAFLGLLPTRLLAFMHSGALLFHGPVLLLTSTLFTFSLLASASLFLLKGKKSPTFPTLPQFLL